MCLLSKDLKIGRRLKVGIIVPSKFM
ncbi:hypothetical protein Zm00014a_007845 [Zea mays]|uniref:Uncharacterized protein n=1 Tax=Zea mays TaxID=4577 RepID=A0A3L6EAQ1_MAIZE|nr:hypothetical protein Zm00014a_007845 [Zea mays]